MEEQPKKNLWGKIASVGLFALTSMAVILGGYAIAPTLAVVAGGVATVAGTIGTTGASIGAFIETVPGIAVATLASGFAAIAYALGISTGSHIQKKQTSQIEETAQT